MNFLGRLLVAVILGGVWPGVVRAADLTVHYHRPEGDYEGWSLWTWDAESKKSIEIQSSARDTFGLVFVLERESYGGAGGIGLLPKFRNWEMKDDPDRYWLPDLGDHVYILSADKSLYAAIPDMSPRVVKAIVEDTDRVRLALSVAAPPDQVTADRVSLQMADGQKFQATAVRSDKKAGVRVKILDALFDRPIPLEILPGATATFADYKPGPVVPGKVLDRFSTDLPLGALYSAGRTVFRTFAPTAIAVNVRLYDLPVGGDPKEHAMKSIGRGVWEATVEEDCLNRYYTFLARHPEGEFEVIDPYSKCNTAHNGRGLIFVDTAKVSPGPTFDPKDAIIYEMHIRDFTIDPASGVSALSRGKYTGPAEAGTRLSGDSAILTGVDHLKELGINVVQIMPFQDFDNSEAGGEYNWGYMPFHFFSPDGWFASRQDDASRVREVKQMIDGFHRNGIKVVMDVVYNHTAEGNPNIRMSFNGLAPGYYYRLREDGSYWNGSGCGNEFRTESPMGRIYILVCIEHWMTEYGIDGLRFDLMGLIDLETVKQIVALARRINPDALIYGEPWAGGATGVDKTEKGDQRGLGFSVFNDHFRDAIKGSTFSNDPGFVQDGRAPGKIKKGIKGSIDDFALSPIESINYVEAHDNHTLWDRLNNTTRARPDVSREDRVKMDKLAAALVLTSQGIPFLHAGQEMLRTKEGEDNTYNKPDTINQIHWRWKKENREVFDYYRGLIQLRRKHPMFRMATADSVRRNLLFLDDDLGIAVPAKTVGYVLHRGESGDEWQNALVVFNANAGDTDVTVPASAWQPAGVGDAGTWGAGGADPAVAVAGASPGSAVDSSTIRVAGRSAAIFFNTDETFFERATRRR